VYDCYKRIVKKIGLPEMRVHDLRHAYAMLALRNGDDVKTVQTLLGHKTPDFTLNVYAYTPDAAKKDSASRMDACIRELTKGS
jgi:integrase